MLSRLNLKIKRKCHILIIAIIKKYILFIIMYIEYKKKYHTK